MVDQAFDHVEAYEKINLSSLEDNVLDQDFTGIKLGDVNGDWTNTNASTLSGRTFHQTEDLMSLGSPRVSPDGQVWFELHAETTQGLLGMQFGLNWDEQVLRLTGIKNHQLEGYRPQAHSHVKGGRAVWYGMMRP